MRSSEAKGLDITVLRPHLQLTIRNLHKQPRNFTSTDKITPTQEVLFDNCYETHRLEKTDPSWIFAQMVGMAACSLAEIIKSNKCTTYAEDSIHLSLQPDATEKVIENGLEELCICINYTGRSRDVSAAVFELMDKSVNIILPSMLSEWDSY
ncbi:hypothetical protein NPIL_144691 [Nephila pilipes]|uniref:Uncharacterized protein n=1 Tax=Nephila pilipes TaxID=299642 RepID=A0A8X6PR81_NEPPI|nr:hypothetical protein NPIL_144691 [Nephila pilipes]